MPRTPEAPAFEIGLVMAGAASAGAYTAGVVDFLLEALQAWEQAKAAGEPWIPDHQVRIRVASGASAGGIVAALLAMLPFTGHHPMRDLADVTDAAEAANAGRNLLCRAWVLETDLRRMLATEDLEAQPGHVPSLLNGSVLAEIADRAIADVRAALPTPPPPPAFLANPLQLYLCLTNMRGVPYVLHMVADETMRGHRVQSHGDHAHFAVFGTGNGEVGPAPAGAICVNAHPACAAAGDGWEALRDAALATSAFPGGFPARAFRNPVSAYWQRPWVGLAEASSCPSLAVSLDLPTAGDAYDFWCVDGGLLDNEPLRYARLALHGDRARGTAADGHRADRAMLLIDPFPAVSGNAADPSGGAPDILQALFALIPMLRAQAAFKPEDLILALSEDVRTRFLIAPIRETMQAGETAMASAGLAGFAGFVHEQFRLHDYQLGRRNCQKFLKDHFFLHIDNPMFAGWRERARRRPERFAAYRPASGSECGGADVEDFAQIVPLVGTVREEVRPRPWPKVGSGADLQGLRKMIVRRAEEVVPQLVHTALVRLGVNERRLINRLLEKIARGVISDRSARAAIASIERDLAVRNLL